ncbi:MAG TPA: glycosyltransferase [Polyangiaceae bacterium]|nr:glycosyltransferase [Polyangiaceae bacterium]
MPRVLFINDYPMVKCAGLCDDGEYPTQHLWGMRDIGEHGFDVEYFPDRTWLGQPKLLRYGVQQLQVALRASGADLVYSASQHCAWLLARMRTLGLLGKPLVSMVHHPLRGALQNGAFVSGHDKLLFLSSRVEQDVKERFKPRHEATATLRWGPDVRFSSAIEPEGQAVDVLAAGKTNRDFPTFVEACRGEPWSSVIYCARGNVAKVLDPPANVAIHTNDTGHVLSYRELYQRSKRVRIIAVPLSEVDALAGLTSVLDALALGKPLIMTRNRWLDFDPQAAGVGYTLDVGDVEGWRQALRRILNDPELERTMGERARAIAERMNIRTFTAELSRHFEHALAASA